MYIHIGQDVSIRFNTIILIVDLEKTTISKITKEFLKISEEEDFITNVSEKIPRTAIICEDNGRSRVYLTNISSSTITKRVNKNRMWN